MDGIVEHPPLTPDEMAAEAWAAMDRQDTDAALHLWRRLRQHSPERPEGHIYPVQVLWQAGRLDEAEAMADAAFDRLGNEPELFVQYAWIAMARQRWDDALNWWTKVRARLPERPDPYIWAARALWQSGRLDAAKAMANDAVERFPDNPDAQAECAWVAVARRDWDEALRRWTLVTERAPERADGRTGLIQAMQVLGRADDTPTSQSVGETPEVGANQISTAELMLSFESLGDRCDFGAVQRNFGVEPLSLLRFGYTKYEALMSALADRFAAVGTVEDTDFRLYNNETILFMKKYGLVFHTFVRQAELPTEAQRDRFREQQRRRLSFLRDKLIGDLEDPQKIFIYASEERVSDTDIAGLFKALRAYGPNSLLYIRPTTEACPEGTVEARGDGLYVGYFSGLVDFVGGEQPPLGLWRQLCDRTYRLARAAA